MATASKATVLQQGCFAQVRRKRLLEGQEEQQLAKKICNPIAGSRSLTLQRSLRGEDSSLSEKENNTPKKQTRPASPCSSFGASTIKASNLAQPTPSKLKETMTVLPAEHALLVDIFSKLQTVYLLYKRRKQQCFFSNCKRPVEEVTSRQFKVGHLLQLKTIYPEALELHKHAQRRQEFPGSAGRTALRDLQCQISIEMPLIKSSANASALQDCSQTLAERLVAWNEGLSCVTSEQSGGACHQSELSHTGRPIPEAELLSVVGVSASEVNSPSAMASPRTPGTAQPGPTPLSTSRKPPTGLRSHKANGKRLSFGDPAATPSKTERNLSPVFEDQQPMISSSPSMMDVSEADKELANRLRRQSLDGTIPVSLTALQAVNNNAEDQANLQSTEMVAARQHAANLACLPRTFDSLRALFGSSGPSVFSKQQVLQRLVGSKGSTSESSDLEAQINFLMTQIPGFVTWTARPEHGISLKIDRKQDMQHLRAKIMCLAVS